MWGKEEILPDRQSNFAAAEALGDLRNRAHLRHRQTSNRNQHADIAEPRLHLRMHPDVAGAVDRSARLAFFRGEPHERKSKKLFRLFEKSSNTPAVDKIL